MKDLPFVIDRNSPTPLYYQLKEELALLIRNGTYPAGSKLPPELTISQELGLSRGTVRQAIGSLVNEGRLLRVQGHGTYVSKSPPVLRLAQHFTSFAEDMREISILFTTQLLSKELIPARGRLLTKLNLSHGDNVVYLKRLGEVEQEPFVLAFTYLSESLCPGLLAKDLINRPLYDVLEQDYGLRLAKATRTLEASIADEHEAKLLGIPLGAPIHFLHSLAFLEDGRPIEYSRLRFRGDRSRISFEVTREN